jgi:hypothetical protein
MWNINCNKYRHALNTANVRAERTVEKLAKV